jgi:hypothetical protein
MGVGVVNQYDVDCPFFFDLREGSALLKRQVLDVGHKARIVE